MNRAEFAANGMNAASSDGVIINELMPQDSRKIMLFNWDRQ